VLVRPMAIMGTWMELPLVKKEPGCAISGFGLSEKVPERNASHLYFMLVSLKRSTLPKRSATS
jgi:hypothetical protein